VQGKFLDVELNVPDIQIALVSNEGRQDFRTLLAGHSLGAQLHVRSPSSGKTVELCPNLPKCSIPRQKNNVDSKARFSYQEGYCLC